MVVTPTLQPQPEGTRGPDPTGDGASPDDRQAGAAETLYLKGRPTLSSYIRFARSHAVNPPGKGELTEEWQAANEVVRALEREEAGIADGPARLQLGPEYEPLLIEFLKDPLIHFGFNTVPTEVVMVELDRLVVYQKHIDLSFVPQLEQALGPSPGREEIFRTCLPFDHPKPPVKWSKVKRNQFVFMSPSNDLRFLGTVPLESRHLTGVLPRGSLVGMVGIAVGFGSNFMNAIYAEGRIILNNGSHRAYTLRKLGFTHAPCIVQHTASRDQLEVVGASDIGEERELYLGHPRPPMLKDYFDPRLHRVFQVRRRLRQIRVKFEIDEHSVPAF